MAATAASAFWFAVVGTEITRGHHGVLLVVGAATLLLAVTEVNQGILRGMLRFSALATVRMIVPATVVVVGIAAAATGVGATGVMAGYLIGSLALVIVTFRLVRQWQPWSGSWFRAESYRNALPLPRTSFHHPLLRSRRLSP